MSAATIRNPILRGFNPDPSICRAEGRFLAAVSSFEWFPGVQIWESDDLASWRLRTRPLNEERLLDLTGVQSSGGVWAPCLSYREGEFYLVFTVVRSWRGESGKDPGAFKDTLNYVTRSSNLDGPWEDPVFANSSGFDPSLFHDDDGRSWFLNMEWDYRGDPTHFSGILLQEFDRETLAPFGPIHTIFRGTERGCVEGPHLYRRGDWYYLVTAEGGTGFEHAVSVARSPRITGPYEVHPNNPVLSSLVEGTRVSAAEPPDGFYTRPQKAGHASLLPISEEEWLMAHLSSRPAPGSAVCPLGRETSLQRVRWTDDWPRVVDNDNKATALPLREVCFPVPSAAADPAAERSPSYTNHDTMVTDLFDGEALHPAFRFLRRDPGRDASLTARPGYLRLIGRESPVSTFRQTVVAMAITAFTYRVEIELEFAPDSFQQMAGLIVRYDERNQYYLRIAGTPEGGRSLGLLRFIAGELDAPVQPEIELTAGPVVLGLEVDGGTGRFDYSAAGEDLKTVSVELDMLALSDDAVWPLGFTGTFVGMACHDMSGRGMHAEFARFNYTERATVS